MNKRQRELIDKLCEKHSLSVEEYRELIVARSEETAQLLAERADAVRRKIYGTQVYIRGLIEISNICKNDCLYCGIRRGNETCIRYRLSKQEILDCCEEGYGLGFRTFVMQGGEDPFFTDDVVCDIVASIKNKFPDCAVTLSLGERNRESYQKLYDAGADRYLLRHETADAGHYAKLHPKEMSYEARMECLDNLRKIGFQTGCGFMVGSPYQTELNLAQDLKFVEQFQPDMCGIGPFIPHGHTPFREFPGGDAGLTCFLLSVIRLVHPYILLPSTTALGTIAHDGRERGILAGANVVMPNLSPLAVRKNYELYNNKISTGEEAAQGLALLQKKMQSIGYEIVSARGDVKKEKGRT